MDSEYIFKLKQEINRLLEERPEYKKFQSDLEKKLKSAGNSHNRMVLLKNLMAENVIRLQESLFDLATELNKINEENNGQ